MDNEGYFIDLTDEEGNNFKLEIVGDVEYEGDLYRVFLPTDMDEEDPDYGFIILKSVQNGDEELLDSVIANSQNRRALRSGGR